MSLAFPPSKGKAAVRIPEFQRLIHDLGRDDEAPNANALFTGPAAISVFGFDNGWKTMN
jgi:hypothetical protein